MFEKKEASVKASKIANFLGVEFKNKVQYFTLGNFVVIKRQ